MVLRAGDPAPEFAIEDVHGTEFVLSEFRGAKSVVLVFLRYLGCPLCQVALQQYRSAYHEFSARGAEVAVFLQSPAATIAGSGDVSAFPFRLIPDPNGSIYRKYRVASGNLLMLPQSVLKAFAYSLKGYESGKNEGNAWQLPGHFVVDETGTIRFAHVGKNMGDNLHPDKLLPFI